VVQVLLMRHALPVLAVPAQGRLFSLTCKMKTDSHVDGVAQLTLTASQRTGVLADAKSPLLPQLQATAHVARKTEAKFVAIGLLARVAHLTAGVVLRKCINCRKETNRSF
jgi:hypothetical protein